MTPRDLSTSTIVARLQLMRELLDDLASVGDPTADHLRDDRLLRRAVERVLTQLVDLAADINQHVSNTLGASVSSEYRESFDTASRLGLFPRELAEQLKPSVGMRNVLIHEYVNVDLAMVSRALPVAREQYARYVRHVADWVSRR
ncbi:type VII toxin-antitoxin system HepT family RNase toxin [Mariniluteicoccus flavus]